MQVGLNLNRPMVSNKNQSPNFGCNPVLKEKYLTYRGAHRLRMEFAFEKKLGKESEEALHEAYKEASGRVKYTLKWIVDQVKPQKAV